MDEEPNLDPDDGKLIKVPLDSFISHLVALWTPPPTRPCSGWSFETITFEARRARFITGRKWPHKEIPCQMLHGADRNASKRPSYPAGTQVLTSCLSPALPPECQKKIWNFCNTLCDKRAIPTCSGAPGRSARCAGASKQEVKKKRKAKMFGSSWLLSALAEAALA